MYKISKEFTFSASHALLGLPIEHSCTRLHGHNYIVTIHLQSEELNENGFVIDYHDLKPIKQYIDDKLDHRHLNDIMGTINSSAENLAKMLYDVFKPDFPRLYAIEVSETPKTTAIYQPE